MQAFSPTFEWQLEDPTSHEPSSSNNICWEFAETNYSDQYQWFLHHSPPDLHPCPATAEIGQLKRSDVEAAGDETAKKLNHNASERDRRKRVNSLFSSLRSLLRATSDPPPKKLSNPATVSRALKYTPELQGEVEGLLKKKEELRSRLMTRQEDVIQVRRERRSSLGAVVSVSPLGDGEVMIQICAAKIHRTPSYSEILQHLEEDGLLLLDGSCFESSGERVFYNLHLQVQGTKQVEFEMLRDKLLPLFEKGQELCPTGLAIDNACSWFLL